MKNNKNLIIFSFIILALISLLTRYNGGVDVHDYADVAKYFAGDYKADIRSSHSMLYGYIHSPLISLFNSFLGLKIFNLLYLFLIILSVYYISGKNRKTLLLILVSPIIWYMGPWINPIQLSSLLFLWAFYFINKYENNEKIKYLFYSGILAGLSWAFWNTVIFILFFFIICFFYNKNINHFIIFLISLFAGLSPLLIFDQIVFGFAFYSIFRHLLGVVITFLYGSIYSGVNQIMNSSLDFLTFIIMLPLFLNLLFSKNIFQDNKRQIIFLILGLLFFLSNPQTRYVLFLWPILILYTGKAINERQLKIQFWIFLILSIIIVIPYLIQISYSTNAADLNSAVTNFGNWNLDKSQRTSLIQQDLDEIAKEYPNSIFVVGNTMDDYAGLANAYWKDDIKEFVSIQDYSLYFENKTSIFEKTIKPIPKINDRRQVWIAGGIQVNENDSTDYNSITLGIGVDSPIELQGFSVIKKYQVLYVSKKK